MNAANGEHLLSVSGVTDILHDFSQEVAIYQCISRMCSLIFSAYSSIIYLNLCERCKNMMKTSYKKLWIILIESVISQATLRKELNIATGTMTKMHRNEEVVLSVLLRICDYLNCNIGDAVRMDAE